MLRLDDPAGSLALLYRVLSDVGRSPGLLLMNVAVGMPVLTLSFFFSRYIYGRSRVAWGLGICAMFTAVASAYFWQYPPGDYYREDDIPEGQFAHMVLLIMFPLLPLLTGIAFAAGGIWPWKRPAGSSNG